MSKENLARLKVTASMFIFGTIGVFVRDIPLPSSVTAMVRGLIGAPFLLLVLLLKKERLNGKDIRRNLPRLLISGAFLGINWILLFEAYRYTTVATATLCYYFAPMIVVLASPLMFGEKLTLRKILCVAAAVVGMALISGVDGIRGLRGILLALGAAVLYAAIVMMNKKIKGISAYDKTIMQLGVSALVLLPYNLLSGGFGGAEIGVLAVVLLLTVGIVHTGLAYFLYFGSTDDLPSQSLAILSYIDPVVAVLLSAFLLKEGITVPGVLGAILILGAAIVCETEQA